MKLLDQVCLERLVSELSTASKRYNVDARLESYSCKMVSEEKRQFKELAARFSGSEAGSLRLGSSQTLRGLWELTGQSVSPSTYQMSTIQDPQSPPHINLSSLTSTSNGGKKRTRSDTTSSSDDGTTTPSSPTPHKSTASSLTLKDMFCLMSTLNSCFGPAYDFLSARSDEFCLEPELKLVKHYISRFCSIYVDKYEDLAPRLWKTIDEEIIPSQCIIYSSQPEVNMVNMDRVLLVRLNIPVRDYRPDHLSDPYSSGCLASFNYFFYNKSLKRVLFFSLRVLNDCFVQEDDEEEGPALY